MLAAAWLAPGCLCLALFAILLTQGPAVSAERSYAAYGGVSIVASLLWGRIVEGATPDRRDMLGACIILFGPRGAPATPA